MVASTMKVDSEEIPKKSGVEKPSRSCSKNNGFIMDFSKKQFTILVLYGVANIFRAAVVLIAGAFYPPEAALKGATGTEIGIVFASQDLTVFFMSLIFGKKILNRIGPQRVVTLSFLGFGICAILFGCTALIQDRTLFVTISILIRILTGICDSGLYPAVFTIYSNETPGSISTAISIFEVFFGIGAIGGPLISGILIDAVGFTLTYAVLGGCILVSTIAIILFVPKLELRDDESRRSDEERHGPQGSSILNQGFLNLLVIPTVLLVIFSLSTTSASIGFVSATLSLHYTNLSPSMTGALFSSGTAIYTAACPVWGYVADRRIISKATIMILAMLIIIVGFVFMGPLPFLPLEKAVWTGFVGYSLMSLGIGGTIMTAYHHALEAAVAVGFTDDSTTYGLVSSLYIATFAMGNSVGPTVSGVLYDFVGFQWGTMFIIGLAALVVIAAAILRMFNLTK